MGERNGKETEWLVEQITHGNKAAFEKLFHKFYARLCKFAWRYVYSTHIAEELVQEIFMEIWESRKHLDSDKNIKTYLYQSVKNNALNHIKHKKLAEEHNEQISWLKHPPATQRHSFKEYNEFEEAAKSAIEELPAGARQIYKLSRKDGLTYNEIAEVLEISPKTVESQMSRALKLLRQNLAKYMPVLTVSFLEVI